MKIAYFHQYFCTPEQGGGTRSYEFAARLIARGHQVHMIASDMEADHSDIRHETLSNGLEVTWIPVAYSNRMSFGRRIVAFFKYAVSATIEARKNDYDLIFATSTPLTIAIPGILSKRKHRVPMVFEVRDLWPEIPIALGALRYPGMRMLAKWLENWAYRNSDAIIALSPGMRDGVLRTGYPEHKIKVIPNSSDVKQFRVDPSVGKDFRAKYAWMGDKPLVIYAGALGLMNDAGYMVDLAYHSLKEGASTQFAIAGAGMEEEKIRQKADSLGVLDKNFHMLGRLPKVEMPALFSASDISCSFFQPLKEMESNSSNKLFDTFAAGRPICINFEGWLKKIIEEHDAGLVVKHGDPEQAARTINKVLANKPLMQQKADNSARLADTKYARDLLAEDFIAVIETVSQEARSSP